MAHFEPRTLIFLGLLTALVSGCARATETRTDQIEPTATQKTAPPRDAGVTADDVQRTPNVPIEQLLQGRVAGVVVSRTQDGGIAVRIRGTTSLTGNNEPLYVLDGIPLQPGPGGSLLGVNPYDIASIKVLKDPADITMYGIRGANGVIIIKTKRPNQ